MAELFLGQIPQIIYFSWFLIFAKRIKEKRLIFTLLMIILYLCLAKIFPNNLLKEVLHMFGVFVTLKFLYKDKARITDIIIFYIATISIAPVIILSTLIFKNIIVVSICFILFAILFFGLLKNKLYKIDNFFEKFWNRNDKNRIKSVTVRCFSSAIINIMFFLMYFWILYGSMIIERR